MDSDGILTDCSIDYENGSSNSYLVIRNKNNISYKNYQVEMILSNSIPGILPVDLRQKNNISGLYYNITSKITLSQFMEHTRFNKDEFINILSNIVKTLLNCRKFLLSDDYFVLHEDYIFINPSSQEAFLMYLPFEHSCSLTDCLRKFTVRVIVEKAKFDENSNGNFLQKILEFVRNESLTIQNFYSFLNSFKNEPAVEQQKKDKSFNNMQRQDTKPDINYETQKTAKPKTKKEQAPSFSIPDAGVLNGIPKKNSPKAVTEPDQKDVKSNPLMLAVLLQVLVVILFFIGKGYLLTLTDDTVSAYGGTGIILISLDFLITRKIFDRKAENSKMVNVSKRAIVSDIRIPDISKKIAGTSQEKSSIKEEISELNILSNITDKKNTPVFTPNYIPDSEPVITDETTVLCEKEPDAPYLSYKHDGIVERINISKNSFIIGRLQEHADYISSNNAVGKVHAEIITKGGLYFLKDLNSRNGSFINGVQVIPNKENEIKSGDRISIANSDFTFFAPVNLNG